MAKKKFNINEWSQKDAKPQQKVIQEPSIAISENKSTTPKSPSGDLGVNDTELIIQRIEEAAIDITSNYSDWRDIGFALADEHGETGRDYFNRISRFFPSYSVTDCNKQFDKCINSKGHGIKIQSLYYIAKQAGINIAVSNSHISYDSDDTPDNSKANESVYEDIIYDTPKINPDVYNNLPDILKESSDMFQEAIEKDVFLIGVITLLSGCLPNIEGIYFNEPHSANLYAFITAPAGSGKGKLKWAKYFGQTIHKSIIKNSNEIKEEYTREFERYNNLSKTQRANAEKPIAPKYKMFFVPANSSSSAFIQALADNDFKAVIFETEADTLSGTLKQEWGNFSDVLRKAFHHESTNMFRRKDNEHIEIEDPHLAIVLSGTPKQVNNMMPDVENGLFSRFLYYAFEDYSDFKNPFISHSSINYVDFFNNQGNRIFELYNILNRLHNPIQFSFTTKQGELFTTEFNNLYKRNRMLIGNDFNANSRRLGLITFRIAMVLSALRIIETGNVSDKIICSDIDYRTSISIVFTLEKHAIAVFQNLPNNNLKGVKLKFLNALPNEFNRQVYLETAEKLNVKPKTAEKYITQFRKAELLNHEHNKYTKTNNQI